MRFFILLFLITFPYLFQAQVIGDITGDEIIDANDYLLLKEIVLEGKAFNSKADIDNDEVISVRDLILLYDFLYENGTQILTLDFEKRKEMVNVSFGQINTKKNSIEIIIKAAKVKAFQFDVSNIDQVELLKSNQQIYILNNTIIGFNAKGYFDKEIVLILKLSSDVETEHCIENVSFIDEIGNEFKHNVGDCVTPSWSAYGLTKVKEIIDNNQFEALADIDRNGEVDIKDYAVLFDYLNLKGPTPPGEPSNIKRRVKLEFVPAEKEQDYFELILSSKDEIFAFDLSFYGLEKLISVENFVIDDIEYTDNRIVWLGNGEKGHKTIILKIIYKELLNSKKICMRAPVFLDESNHYFGIKLGRCYDIYVEKIIPPVVEKIKKKKAPKPEKIKKEKEPKKTKEKKEPKIKEDIIAEKKTKKKLIIEDAKSVEQIKEFEEFEEVEESVEEENINENELVQEEVNDKENQTESEKSTPKEKVFDFGKNKEKSPKKEKKKGTEPKNPKSKSTVKILSLNKLQIKNTKGKKGQMIFNNEENIFMLFDGTKWNRLNAVPNISISD